MRFEQFDPKADEQRLRSCHQIIISAQEEDDPGFPPFSSGAFCGWWAHGLSDEPRETWLARADHGEPAGCYLLELPQQENVTIAFLTLGITRSYRRRGLGQALLTHCRERAALNGRTLLETVCRTGSPGAAFAVHIGAEPGLSDLRSVLTVDAPALDRLPALCADAAAQASRYSLRHWSGPVPDDLLAQNAALEEALADAPHAEWFEKPKWDGDRIRAAEDRVAAQGLRRYSIAAIHDATGEMAALTQLSVDPLVTGWAFQDITAVVRAHRGHRLGVLVKAAMLKQLAELEPQVKRVITFNAADNEHMIAVNKALGFQPDEHFRHYQLELRQPPAEATG
jgi:RimJ/RimL family protein N-acetyltransferase